MRVLQVHTTYRLPGGEDTVVEGEATLLRAAGHDVVRYEAANADGARSAGQLLVSPWNPAAARAVRVVAEQARPDVAHVHNTWFAMSPSVPAALARLGVPVVATLHNYRRVCVNASLYRDGRPCLDCVGRSPWPGVRHRCYRDSAVASAAAATTIALDRRLELSDRHVAVFLVLNRFMEQVLVRGGLPADRVVVKGNSVPDPGARPAPPSQGSTVLVLGRVETLKGVDRLVTAWERVRPPGLELVVVGDGPLRAPLEARQVPAVRFVGQQSREQVRGLLLEARALVLASRLFEGQPMSVLEAMAAGLPVLAPCAGGNPDLLSDLGEGWLVDPADPEAWETALGQLAGRSDDEVDAAGRAARARWSRDHSAATALRLLEGAYARAAA
jgi:glycosyltransferase involved in cell wall biosynthesis